MHAYNFVPGSHLEGYLAILRRLRIKLHAIALGLGADQPVLGVDVTSGAGADDGWQHLRDTLHGRLPSLPPSDPSGREERLRALVRAHGIDADARNPASPRLSPAYSCVTSAAPDQRGLFLALEDDARGVRAYSVRDGVMEEIDPLEMAERCRAGGHRESSETASDVNAIRAAVRRIRDTMRADHRPRPCSRTSSVASAAARALQLAIASEPGGPDDRVAADVERLLLMLAKPLVVSAEQRLERCHPARETALTALISMIDPALSDADSAISGGDCGFSSKVSRGARWRLVAALSVV